MSLRRSLRGVASSLLGLVRTRLELMSLEAAEEKSRVIALLGMAAAALLFLALALLVLTAAIAVAFWPTEQRYIALACLGGLYALIGLVLLYKVRHELVTHPIPFAATLEVLERDVAALEQGGSEAVAAAGRER
ncbi:MAG TPA: phage holin family protein [Bordetella sp.]